MPDQKTQLIVALIAAAGALLVAWIGGGFSLLGLIISKEQQVSGFRQSWIDGLRADLGVFVARVHQIASYIAIHKPFNFPDFWKATHDDYNELNEASIRIKLRLNPDESGNQLILGAMGAMEKLFNQMGDPKTVEKIKEITDMLEDAAPPLLKQEWVVVKNGEPIYRRAKVLAMSIFIAAPALIGLLLWILWTIH